MSQYTFAGIRYFCVPESNYLAPHGANFALYEYGGGNGQDSANSYNVYRRRRPASTSSSRS